MVSCSVKREAPRISIHDIPADISPDALLALTQQHPHLLEQLHSNDPELSDTLRTGNVEAIRLFMMKRYFSRHKSGHEKEVELASIAADPMNEENQRKIEDAIRLANVQQNMEMAIENLPE